MGFDAFPRLGPFKLGDHGGMKQAIGILMRLQEPGRTEGSRVKYSTTRKAQGAYTRLHAASPEFIGDTTFSSGKQRLTATCNPTQQPWFAAFMQGLYSRMGKVTEHERALTIKVMLELEEMWEEMWDRKKARISWSEMDSISFLVNSFCGGMRGFKTEMADLKSMVEMIRLQERKGNQRLHYLSLVGRFKLQTGIGCHLIPVANESDSGLQPGKWTRRHLKF